MKLWNAQSYQATVIIRTPTHILQLTCASVITTSYFVALSDVSYHRFVRFALSWASANTMFASQHHILCTKQRNTHSLVLLRQDLPGSFVRYPLIVRCLQRGLEPRNAAPDL